LAQPTFVTQAPGDPANIIYYSTRITAANGTGGGFGTVNAMGGIFRYDMNTRTSTQVMNLAHRQLTGDEGLAGFAFSPDFNTPGAPGYQKLYVSSSQFNGNGTSPTDRVEEYVVSGPNGTVPQDGVGRPVVNRVVLEYLHVNTQQNHTVDWVGFDPRASSLSVGSPERNYLYIVTGDGALGASAQNRPEQKANDIRGKLLRVDVDVANHGDAYPADPNKNFAIPPDNPIPLWNAAHPPNEQLASTTLNYTTNPMSATYAPALGELYATGLRNTYRMSFDRMTGDFWGGDVGENGREEINFLKADTYTGSQPPVDFGYAQREGTLATGDALAVNGSTGATTLQWNLSGGGTQVVNSANPVREGAHATVNTPDEVRTTNRSAYIGGYVYRGPVESLQGQYFYSDFIHSNIFKLSEFDRNIPLESYSGTNFNLVNGVAALGTRTTVATANANSLWQSLIVDPTDPNYTAAQGLSFGIGRAVSFGEDNAGNLYIVDFGSNRGDPSFGGDYPAAGLGEIFRIVPTLQITLTINRDTGAITFSNDTGEITNISGYTVRSGAGSLERNAMTPITGRLDAPPTGDGSIDPNNAWMVTSDSGDRHEFSEESTGGPASLSIDEQFVLSPEEGWIPSIYEDVQLTVVLGNGTEVPAMVEFVGNGGQPFDRSDLNFNGLLDPADWPIFRSHHLQNFPSLTRAEAYHQGDLDGDGDNDFADFRLFQADYIAANGAAAFDALLSVPEPTSVVLAIAMLGMAGFYRRRNRTTHVDALPTCRASAGPLLVCAVMVSSSLLSSTSQAALRHRYSFSEGTTANASGRTIIDSINGANGTVRGAGASANATQLILPGGASATAAYVDLPNGIVSSLTDATFEAWYTIDTTEVWARIFDFGSTAGGELTGPGGGGGGEDYIFYGPMRGNVIDEQRAAIRNNDPLFGPGGTAGIVGGTEAAIDPEFNHTLDVQYHMALVFDANGGNDPGEATMTLYINGALPPGELNNPLQTTIQLNNLNDVNNWLGRSNWTSDTNFDGMLNEFRIYDQALSASDVAESFTSGPDVLPVLEVISLEVNTITGAVKITNNVESPVNLDYYKITSAGGALDTAAWNSLADQNRDAIGPGQGQSWDEADQSNEFALAELYLLGASGVSSTSPLTLGHAFDVTTFGAGMNGDLQFQYARKGGGLVTGDVTYVRPGPLAGDYNHNGTVDAADYVVWRNTLGSTTALDADGDNDGDVDLHDYTVWRAKFGNTAGASAAAPSEAVPEPGAAFVLAASITFAVTMAARARPNDVRSSAVRRLQTGSSRNYEPSTLFDYHR
jgi:hypothetical protein